MADIREMFPDEEEAGRSQIAGVLKHTWSSLVHVVSEDTTDGHVAKGQPAIKRRDLDPYGNETFTDHPVHDDLPIHFSGGGGVTHTHPVKKGDEVLVVYASRPIDTWHNQGGTENVPAETRMHSLSDGVVIGHVRSTPRKLHQFEKDASQIRSDDKKNVLQMHPVNGVHTKTVDPSTPAASESFDPYTQATKFFEHVIHPANGILGAATSSGVTHDHGITHELGAFMRANNAEHSALVHPTAGASLNASNLLHSVFASPTLGAMLSAGGGQHTVQAHPTAGVMISSSMGIALSTPSLSLPPGSISMADLSPEVQGALGASLGGDLRGDLSYAMVVGLSNVTGANLLPNFANDTQAATGGVPVGHLYRNGSALLVRVS